ncbi:MAG: hypothetical protein KGV43_01665 [Arcobacter sp.]|nr:hypothetical protein [Arcobacter sp.]
MNVTITNINQDTLNAIEVLLKPFIKKNNMQIIKEKPNSLENIIEEFEKEQKEGKTKIYDSFDDFKKAMSV